MDTLSGIYKAMCCRTLTVAVSSQQWTVRSIGLTAHGIFLLHIRRAHISATPEHGTFGKVMCSIERGTKKAWKARRFSCVFLVRIVQESASKIPSQAAYTDCLGTRRRYSLMSTGTHIASGRVCGLKICRRYSRRTSWSLWGHGARLAATAISTAVSIKGFLQKTEQKTGAKLFRGLQKQWRSSGAEILSRSRRCKSDVCG